MKVWISGFAFIVGAFLSFFTEAQAARPVPFSLELCAELSHSLRRVVSNSLICREVFGAIREAQQEVDCPRLDESEDCLWDVRPSVAKLAESGCLCDLDLTKVAAILQPRVTPCTPLEYNPLVMVLDEQKTFACSEQGGESHAES